MVVYNGPRVCNYSLGCIIGTYYMLWVSLAANRRVVLGYGEHTILMHIDTVGFMHAKLEELMQYCMRGSREGESCGCW